MAATSRKETTNLGMSRMSFSIGTIRVLCLELHDLVPQAGILLLVGGPDLLLRHLFEGVDVGLDDHHALGFELLLGGGEVVDRFGKLAALGLRLAAGVEH